MPTVPTHQNGDDQEASAALSQVKLDLFIAEPGTIEPFTGSKLSWKVTVPKNFDDVNGKILFDRVPVPEVDERLVAPDVTTSYKLTKQAGRYEQFLGEVTVLVDSARCITLRDVVEGQIAEGIRATVNADSSLSFRSFAPWPPPPLVWTTDDGHLKITLRLKKEIHNSPDPNVDIDASFGLQVVQGDPQTSMWGGQQVSPWPSLRHHLAPVDVAIKTDVSVPIWARPFLSIQDVIQGNLEAREKADSMVTEIVDILNRWFGWLGPKPPPGSDMHAVRLFRDMALGGMFAVTFCPVPQLPT